MRKRSDFEDDGRHFLSAPARIQRMAAELDEASESSDIRPDELTLRNRYPLLPRIPLELVVAPLAKAVNHGGLLRIAEAFRLERVIFEAEADRAWDGAAHRGALKWQPWEWGEVRATLERARAAGRRTIALTFSTRAIPVAEYHWHFPASLVIGSEWTGVPEGIADLCDDVLMIPMYGLMGSLNVAVATGIAVHSASMQWAKENPEFEPARAETRGEYPR